MKLLCVAFGILFCCLYPSDAFSQNPEKIYQQVKDNLPYNIKKADELSRRYLSIGVQARSEEIKAKYDYLQGLINYYRSRYYISTEYYLKAANSGHAKTDLSLREACYNNMGINYEIQNLFPQSLESYQKSLRIAEKLNDSISIGQSWINIGLLNAKVKNYEKAKNTTFTALEYFKNKKDSLNIALCYQNLTVICSDQGNFDQAISYIFKGLVISEALGNQYEIAGSYYNLANNYSYKNDLEKSDYYVAKALQVAPYVGNREGLLAKVYLQSGINRSARRDFEGAKKDMLHALHLAQSTGATENEDVIYMGLADLYAKSGNYDAYVRTIEEFNHIKADREAKESIARVDELQALYQFQKNADTIENQQRDIQTRNKQLTVLIFAIIIILCILLVILFMHLRMRRYMRSLFENKVEQTKHDALISETVIEDDVENKELFAIYNGILALMNEKKLSSMEHISISDISLETGIPEEKISRAIQLFGNKDFRTFLDTYYIDDICKKMIESGRNLSLKKIVADYAFSNYSAFQKQFKEITGLTPEQFMDYSEEKLQNAK